MNLPARADSIRVRCWSPPGKLAIDLQEDERRGAVCVVGPGRYRHYKGQEYEVIGIGKHSETMERLVFYRALYGEMELWARPAEMFLEKVAVGDLLVQRFEPVSTDLEESP